MAKIVDLTQTLKSDIHIYPDDPKFSAKPAFEVPKRDGFRVHALRLGTHTGTHIDAPYHAYKNGKKIDEVPLEWLVGRPVVIDLSSLVGNRDCFRIEWEHLAEYEEEIYKADQGDKILSIRTLQVGTLIRKPSNHFLLFALFPGLISFDSCHFSHFLRTYLSRWYPGLISNHLSHFSSLISLIST